MLFDRVDFLGRKFRIMAATASQGAKGSIALVPPGAAGNLRHLSAGQPSLTNAIKFAEPSKGDMTDIKVQTHANRIGGNQIVNLTVLV